MKSYGQLWERIVSEENLRAAWHRVKLGRGRSRRIASYGRRIERNLARLRQMLLDGSYQPGHYRQFRVMDPKPRTISCAPVQDRVVHHALCGVIAPLLERSFVNRSYACRVGYGTHLACVEARRELARHKYFVKLDVRHYFQSIWHERLLSILEPMFREREVRALLRKVICHPVPGHEAGRGVPIGNLTSQWFANVYLNALDHYVMEELGAGKAYFRYMDDILVFCETKEEAQRYHAKISNWLDAERGLELKEKATRIAPVKDGVPFLGLRMWREHWRLKRSRYLHARRAAAGRARLLARGGISEKQYADGLVSMAGVHAWFGFENILRGVEAPGEKAQMPFAHRGNKCGGLSPSVAGAGTTMPRTRALRAAMVTMACRTRTTTSASASPAPLKGGSHPGQRPVLRAMRAEPNTHTPASPVTAQPRPWGEVRIATEKGGVAAAGIHQEGWRQETGGGFEGASHDSPATLSRYDVCMSGFARGHVRTDPAPQGRALASRTRIGCVDRVGKGPRSCSFSLPLRSRGSTGDLPLRSRGSTGLSRVGQNMRRAA